MSLPVYAPPPVHRQVYRAHLRASAETDLTSVLDVLAPELQQRVTAEDLLTLSLFRWANRLFLYYERPGEKLPPEELVAPLDPLLEQWPGEHPRRSWVPMMDIFHYSRPLSTGHWQRQTPPKERTARVIYLRPEMLSSYIFYHFQLQEENPGALNRRYGMICMHENLLFFYIEKPDIAEDQQYPGHLKTSNTPPNWGEVMNPHFQPWPDEDGERLWRPIECLLGI